MIADIVSGQENEYLQFPSPTKLVSMHHIRMHPMTCQIAHCKATPTPINTLDV